MGVTKRQAEPPQAHSGRGGSFRSLSDARNSGPAVDSWLSDLTSDLGVTTRDALIAGIAVLYSITSDGGAVSVTVYDREWRGKSYAGDPEELQSLLGALRDRASERLARDRGVR